MAVSVSDPAPSTMPGDATVAIDGGGVITTVLSSSASHGASIAALFASPV